MMINVISHMLTIDGCISKDYLIPSFQNDSSLDFNITFPETNLGQTVTIECPCGGLNLSSTALIATRKCGGTYDSGAEWEKPDVSACNFTDSIRRLCNLASVCWYTDLLSASVNDVIV